MKTLRELREKTLTPAEKKKREEIAKAMEKDNPDMPMDKKMAIATATAKRVAEEKTVRQLLDPKKEVMVVKMMGKRHKVIVIDKSKEKEYLSKGWTLAEETQLDEDGHTDVASMKNKVKIAMSALQKMQTELGKLQDGDSLPSWWTNKVAVAVDKLDGMADYIDTQVESVQEATDLYNKGGIQIVRVSMARGKVGVEMTVGNKQIELSDVQFKNLQRALPKINLRQGLGEATDLYNVELNETASMYLHIKGMRTAAAHAKKDGADLKDKDLMRKYHTYHMKKNNRMTHFTTNSDGSRDFNSIGKGTKIEPKHYKDIFKKNKKESVEEAVTEAKGKYASDAQMDDFLKGMEKHPDVKKMSNHYNRPVGDIVKALRARVSVNRLSGGNVYTLNFTDKDSKLKVKAKKRYAPIKEAVSPAQQAAIAISKKERGEKPKNEASAAADARRAMKSRGATKGMATTKKDKDTEATDDDRKAASKNIIMQLRKAADLPTGAEVDFNRGKGKVSRDQAKAALARFDALSKPNEKERFQKSIRSLSDIKKILGR